MSDLTPLNAYDLLTSPERLAIDDYVKMVESEAARRGERVAVALQRPVPAELARRARGMFSKPLVRAALAERLQSVADKQDITPGRVVREQAALAFSNIGDFLSVGMFGELNIDLTQATREQLACVKSVETTDTPTGRKIKIQLYDKTPALQSLAAIMSMPNLTDSPRAGHAARIGQGADAEKAYTALLESMRP